MEIQSLDGSTARGTQPPRVRKRRALQVRKPRAARVDRASKEGCFYRLLPISGGREAHPWGSPAGPASGTGHGEPFSGSKSFTRTATCPCTAGPHKSPPSAGPEGGERGSTGTPPGCANSLLLVLATPSPGLGHAHRLLSCWRTQIPASLPSGPGQEPPQRPPARGL